MLRVDNKAEVVKVGLSLSGLFTGRLAIRSGRRIYHPRWKEARMADIRSRQQTNPVLMLCEGKRALWFFTGSFYWDDDGLAESDVKALVLQRKRQLDRKLQTAHSLMRAESDGRPVRAPIPSDLRRAVFERDGGTCVECGSNFDLQYDHVLPVSLGGATTLQNLQLLCAGCNRNKSDTL